MQRDLQFAAAEWIRADWDSTASPREKEPVRFLKCDQYQSGRRPLIKMDPKWSRLGFMTGGQNYPDFLLGTDILPDYLVLRADSVREDGGDIPEFIGFGEKVQEGVDAKAYRQVHVDTIDGITFAVFKNPDLPVRD